MKWRLLSSFIIPISNSPNEELITVVATSECEDILTRYAIIFVWSAKRALRRGENCVWDAEDAMAIAD